METIEEVLDRLDQGQGSPEDIEALAKMVRRAIQYTGAPTSHTPLKPSRPNLYSLMHAITEIASGMEIDPIAAVTTAKILSILHPDSCTLFGWDGSNNALTRLSERMSPEWQSPFRWPERIPVDTFPWIGPLLQKNQQAQLFARDTLEGSSEQAFFQLTSASKAIWMPVSVHGNLSGAVALLFQRGEERSSAHEMVILRLLANQAGISIENATLFNDARQHTRELEAVHQASLTLTASLDLQQVFDAILNSTLSLLKDIKDAHIFLYEEQSLSFGAALWADGSRNQFRSMPRKDGLTYSVALRGAPIHVKDMSSNPIYHGAPSDWTGSIIGLPLMIGKRVVGVMNVARGQTGGFKDSEVRVLRLLADQAALAIENARLHNLISQQALTDSLTNLPNRRHFDRHLEEEISRSKRYRHGFALMMMDLDHFKAINDTYGHPVGDAVLIHVAALLAKSLHDTDFLARFGGDEFALILPETGTDGAQTLARRLQRLLHSNPFPLQNDQVRRLSASIGHAVYPDEAASAADLVDKADQMLYRYKHGKR